ncbi:MAG: glycosyltransferase family 2 protein [Prevotella sp.]|nr:glycosyltransferase family 2 protein [Prevotella sp.]
MLKKDRLSILLPSYNNVCYDLVEALSRQAEALSAQGLCYEILVADDGSDDMATLRQNERIVSLPHTRLLKHSPNVGRAAIRNYLWRQSQYAWLLFIDSDVAVCRTDFLEKYLTSQGDGVVYGGICMDMADGSDKHNLRFMYESAAEPKHTYERRRKEPYSHFHTANFLVARPVMQANPFDERFRTYGYEDVLLGCVLERMHVSIEHIDNPVSLLSFEDNLHFVEKTEESLRTLWQFRDELIGYNALLDTWLRIMPSMGPLCKTLFRMFGPHIRRNLAGKRPCLTLFNIYRLGYMAEISQ